MTSQHDGSVVEGTRYVLDLLLAADGLKFSHQQSHHDDALLTSVKVAQSETEPNDYLPHLETNVQRGRGLVESKITATPLRQTSSHEPPDGVPIETPITKANVAVEYTPGASKHYKQEQLDKIAEQIKKIGDELNPEIEQKLQNMLLKKVLLSSSEVTYSTFEEWMKEFLNENQYCLVDKSDKYKAHLFLMCVKVSLRIATKQLRVTSVACQRLYDFSVSFVVRNYPNWIG